MFERLFNPDAGMLFDDEPGAAGGSNGGAETPETEESVTMTQSELNAMIAREKSKAGKSAVKAHEAEQARKQSAAQETDEQKARQAQQDADRRIQEAEARANSRLVKADARGVASSLGFRDDRLAEVVQFADLSDVEVDDDGEPDKKAIEAALKPLLKRFPEWTKAKRDLGGGANPGGEDRLADSSIPEKNRAMNDMFRRGLGQRG